MNIIIAGHAGFRRLCVSLVVRHKHMMRVIQILFIFMLAIGCSRTDSGPRPVVINTLESVDSRQVIHDGKPWVEITISQKVNPKAPAYVVGIRESKWANRLRWALVEQKIDTERVISRFRFRPVEEFAEIRLDRDDFEWYPQVSGFQPVAVVLKNAKALERIAAKRFSL